MRRAQLPISALPVWSKLNDVSFLDIDVRVLGAKGYGLATERALTSKEETFDIPALLLVPQDLILSREAIKEHAKVDHHFRQLLNVAGGKSLRGDILLFLLMQITIASPEHGQNVGLSNPWTEYVKILPGHVPVPTIWSDEERIMLLGTSLESALDAKLASLFREYEALRVATIDIPWCYKCWWESEALSISDWKLVDAWFRSRSLELPSTGQSMIPCVDMVNHSSVPNSYYEPAPNGGVNLLLRPGVKLEAGDEVTISYGTSKSAAEMLFSYGFIDEGGITRSLALTLEPFLEDPLGKAKASAFLGPRVVRLFAEEDRIHWEGPFLYLMCLNEEDGLDFKVLQQTDGSMSSLRTFWQDTDVTDVTNTFESLIKDHALKDVFELRAVALLQDRIQQQLERLRGSEDDVKSLADIANLVPERQNSAIQLRKNETTILQEALVTVELQKTKLLENEVVLRYLGSMDDEDEPEQAGVEGTNNDEDFS